MVKKTVLSICVAALFAMMSWGCHRNPVNPSEEGQCGEITTETIVEEGVETAYSLSYRSWIIPGEGNSETKSAASPKSGSSHDTVSVILHDNFYNVDTCAYVTGWEPEKYASYTCQWIRSANVSAPENNITMIDSVAILRVQYAEFSFDYYIRFEVAHYNDGSYSCLMPHYSPIVTDLGAQELEDLQTFVKDGNVYARKLLKHSIRVVIGNTPYVLNAVDTLYRHLPDANPSRFVVWSEVLNEVIPTQFQTYENQYSLLLFLYYPYRCTFRQHYSDGSTNDCEVIFDSNVDADKYAFMRREWPIPVDNENAHCDNVISLYGVSSIQEVPEETFQEQICEFLKLTTQSSILTVNFFGVGVSLPYNKVEVLKHSYVYDDGYTFMQKSFDPSFTFSRMEKECDNAANQIRLKMFFNYAVENLQTEYYTCYLLFDHL